MMTDKNIPVRIPIDHLDEAIPNNYFVIVNIIDCR